MIVTTLGRIVTGIYRVEARDAVKRPTMHRTGPQQRIIQPQILIVPRLSHSVLECVSLEVNSYFYLFTCSAWLKEVSNK